VSDAKPAAVRANELRGDILEVRHTRDIDPAIRDRDDDVGAAKAERRQELDRAVDVGERLADQVLPRNAEMHAPRFQLVHDLGGRGQHYLDAVKSVQRGTIAALVALVA